jgi:hypothetical protein
MRPRTMSHAPAFLSPTHVRQLTYMSRSEPNSANETHETTDEASRHAGNRIRLHRPYGQRVT